MFAARTKVCCPSHTKYHQILAAAHFCTSLHNLHTLAKFCMLLKVLQNSHIFVLTAEIRLAHVHTFCTHFAHSCTFFVWQSKCHHIASVGAFAVKRRGCNARRSHRLKSFSYHLKSFSLGLFTHFILSRNKVNW